MTTHPGTDIPCKTLSKAELCQLLNISPSTLRRWSRRCESALLTVPGYNKNASLLSPMSVAVILRENGYIRPNSAESG